MRNGIQGTRVAMAPNGQALGHADREANYGEWQCR